MISFLVILYNNCCVFMMTSDAAVLWLASAYSLHSYNDVLHLLGYTILVLSYKMYNDRQDTSKTYSYNIVSLKTVALVTTTTCCKVSKIIFLPYNRFLKSIFFPFPFWPFIDHSAQEREWEWELNLEDNKVSFIHYSVVEWMKKSVVEIITKLPLQK